MKRSFIVALLCMAVCFAQCTAGHISEVDETQQEGGLDAEETPQPDQEEPLPPTSDEDDNEKTDDTESDNGEDKDDGANDNTDIDNETDSDEGEDGPIARGKSEKDV